MVKVSFVCFKKENATPKYLEMVNNVASVADSTNLIYLYSKTKGEDYSFSYPVNTLYNTGSNIDTLTKEVIHSEIIVRNGNISKYNHLIDQLQPNTLVEYVQGTDKFDTGADYCILESYRNKSEVSDKYNYKPEQILSTKDYKKISEELRNERVLTSQINVTFKPSNKPFSPYFAKELNAILEEKGHVVGSGFDVSLDYDEMGLCFRGSNQTFKTPFPIDYEKVNNFNLERRNEIMHFSNNIIENDINTTINFLNIMKGFETTDPYLNILGKRCGCIPYESRNKNIEKLLKDNYESVKGLSWETVVKKLERNFGTVAAWDKKVK